MINGRTVLAIIPARGGSKGIPRKNIKLLAGKPLIAWTIEEAKKSKYIDRLILSSEDEEIISVAKQWGCDVPFIRPKELAQDDTPGIEPIVHAINALPQKFNYVILLQPTSPLRRAEHIDKALEYIDSKKVKSLVSIMSVNEHPEWMYRIDINGVINKFMVLEHIVPRRQDLEKLFILNGAIYIAELDFLLKNKSFIDNNTVGYLMEKRYSIDLDNEIDFYICEYLMSTLII